MSDVHSEWFGLDEDDAQLKVYQDRVCSASEVAAIAYEAEEKPPYIAVIYLVDVEPHPSGVVTPTPPSRLVCAGNVWRDDRWPTTAEIADALTSWRGEGGPKFTVRWNIGTKHHDEVVHLRASEGPCDVHEWPSEGMGERLVTVMRERHGKGGVNVCRECLVRARSA